MISTGQITPYFTADVITYTCKSGYTQRNARDIICICKVENVDNWACSIPDDDFASECVKG